MHFTCPDTTRHGEFIVETDASDYCIGRVLEQDQGHSLQPVAYYNKKLTSAPWNYATHEFLLLAIVVIVKNGDLT